MQTAIVTLFPELFAPFLATSFVKRALDIGQLSVWLEPLREHGVGRHRSVDDTPCGGGSGMVLRPDVVIAALEAAEARVAPGARACRVLLTPQGRPFDQAEARALAESAAVVFVCGRYEGFDERVRAFVDREISLGDFVLTGGEVPVMAILEACVRLLPGVLGNADSAVEESFSVACAGGLEHPQYTRPTQFRGHDVPEVLLSGDHGRIERWRREQSRLRTLARRPDLAAAGTVLDAAKRRGPA